MGSENKRKVIFRHSLAAAITAALAYLILLPLLIQWSYHNNPPEIVHKPRTATISEGAPGTRFLVKGEYEITRDCSADFASVKEWIGEDGRQYVRIPMHFGSVAIHPKPKTEISRSHTIPLDARPGTEYKFRTTGKWYCFPWAGYNDHGWVIDYEEIVVRVTEAYDANSQ